MWLLTFDFVLGLFSPPLELFAVVVEPLQAHDAVLQTGTARTRDVTQPSRGLSIAGQVAWRDLQGDPLPYLLSMCPKDASVQGWVSTDTTQREFLGQKTGNVPPLHGNSPLHRFYSVLPA